MTDDETNEDDADRLLHEALDGHDPSMALIAESGMDMIRSFIEKGYTRDEAFAIVQPVLTGVIGHIVQAQMRMALLGQVLGERGGSTGGADGQH